MTTNRLEELWDSADDGASCPARPVGVPVEADLEGLLDAWYLERDNSIECEILLDRSRKLIRRLLAHEFISNPDRKRAELLIGAIKTKLRNVDRPEG